MHSFIWCFVWRDRIKTQWAFVSSEHLLAIMTKYVGDSGLRSEDTGAALKPIFRARAPDGQIDRS